VEGRIWMVLVNIERISVSCLLRYGRFSESGEESSFWVRVVSYMARESIPQRGLCHVVLGNRCRRRS